MVVLLLDEAGKFPGLLCTLPASLSSLHEMEPPEAARVHLVFPFHPISPAGAPLLQTWGGSRRSFVGQRRVVAWSSLPVQRGRHQGIIIAIGLLQFATKPGRNPLDLAHT